MEKKDDFMWALLMHLPANIEAFHAVTDRMAEVGMNTLVMAVHDGVRLPSHPEIARKDAWSPETLQEELARLRKLGITPVPKCNFSMAHAGWTGKWKRVCSTPEYYGFCADVIRDVATLFGKPRLFHMGMDEEGDLSCQSRCDYVVVRGEELFWHDLRFYRDEIVRHGARAWMWGDEAWFRRDAFYRNFTKDILISNWFYGRTFNPDNRERNYEIPRIKSYAEFESKGYDQVPCGTVWIPDYMTTAKCRANDVNFPLTVAHCRAAVAPERLKGFLMSVWSGLFADNREKYLHAVDLVAQSMRI